LRTQALRAALRPGELPRIFERVIARQADALKKSKAPDGRRNRASQAEK
jgi:hypothetical protein